MVAPVLPLRLDRAQLEASEALPEPELLASRQALTAAAAVASKGWPGQQRCSCQVGRRAGAFSSPVQAAPVAPKAVQENGFHAVGLQVAVLEQQQGRRLVQGHKQDAARPLRAGAVIPQVLHVGACADQVPAHCMLRACTMLPG